METVDTSESLKSVRWQQWADEQAKFEASGLTVREFCRQHNLGASTFYLRRAALRKLGHQVFRGQRISNATSPVSPTSVGFVDAGVFRAEQHVKTLAEDIKAVPTVAAPPGLLDAGTALELRIELGLGVVLTIARR